MAVLVPRAITAVGAVLVAGGTCVAQPTPHARPATESLDGAAAAGWPGTPGSSPGVQQLKHSPGPESPADMAAPTRGSAAAQVPRNGTGEPGLRGVPPPDQPGPFGVGRHTFAVVDSDRGRTLIVETWYPVDPPDVTGPLATYNASFLVQNTATVLWPSTLARQGLPVSLAGPFPLVVYSHSGCGWRWEAFNTCEILASHGFVVMGVDHPGNSVLTGCNAPLEQSAVDRPQDVSFIITRMLTRSNTPGDAFFGRIDPERIGATGFSFGGFTAMATQTGSGSYAGDPRVGAVVSVAGSLFLPTAQQLSQVEVPAFLFSGTLDGLWETDRWAIAHLSGPRLQAAVQDMHHRSALPFCAFDQYLVEAGYAAHVINAYRSFVGNPCPVDVVSEATVHRLRTLYTTAFFKRHLAGQTGYDVYLTAAYAAEHEPDVYEFRTGVAADCNGNFIPDVQDIASGASADVNGNGIPDECEEVVLYVDSAATGLNHGTSWADAFTDLQSALRVVEAAPPVEGRQIWVAAGTYVPDEGTGQRSRSFRMGTDVAIYGGFVAVETTLSQRDPVLNPTILSGDLLGDDGPAFANRADNSFRVVSAVPAHGSALLDGFTIRGGNADWPETGNADGGGFFAISWMADCAVSNCRVEDNFAARRGGALMQANGAAVRFDSCSFHGNRAAAGGAGFLSESLAEFNNCVFRNNNSTATSGTFGGGVLRTSTASTATFINCVLADNTAAAGGSAIRTHNTQLTIINCTVVGNAAPGVGAVDLTSSSQLLLRNSIVRGNTPTAITASGSGVSVSYCNIPGWAGIGNINVDPLFTDVAAGDYSLQSGSPCIDAGSNTAVPPAILIDLAGKPRFHDDPGTPDTGLADPSRPELPIVDMGALEFQGDSAPPCPADWNDDGEVNSLDISAFITSWLNSVQNGTLDADFDGDGVVNSTDISVFITAWLAAVVGGC